MTVWASAANLSRSGSELSNLRTEQQRMLTQNNALTQVLSREKDGRSEAAEGDDQKVADKASEALAADQADTAATIGIISACLSIASTVVSFNGKNSGAFGMELANGLFSLSNAILEKFKTMGEKDILNREVGRLKKEANAEDKAVRALDQNPGV